MLIGLRVIRRPFEFCVSYGKKTGMEISGQTITDKQFSNADLQKYYFDSCLLLGCSFQGANLNQARIINCEFRGCDLSSARVEGARIADAKFSGCKMLGIDFSKVDRLIFGASFTECLLSKSSFFGLSLKNFLWQGSELISVDFSECDLTNADFSGSDLKNAIFHRTNLSKAHLQNAKNYRINPLSNKIVGAEVSLSEGSSFLLELGLKIV